MKSTVAISLQLLAASQLATGLTIPPLHQKGVKISEEAPQDIVTRSLLGEILPSPIDSSGDEIYGASLEKRKPPISSCCDRTPSGGGGTGPGGADDIALANRPVNSQNQGDQSQGSQSQGGVAALPPGVRGGDSITPALAPKPVPDVFAPGTPYTQSVRNTADSRTNYNIQVTNPGGQPQDMNWIGVGQRGTARDGEIFIETAFNRRVDQTSGDQKKYLSDILMALFNRVEGRDPTELNRIEVDKVTDENPGATNTINSMQEVRRMNLPTNPDGSITVRSSAAPGSDEKKAFDKMWQSNYGQIAERVNVEFSVGKQVSQFDIKTTDDLTISYA